MGYFRKERLINLVNWKWISINMGLIFTCKISDIIKIQHSRHSIQFCQSWNERNCLRASIVLFLTTQLLYLLSVMTNGSFAIRLIQIYYHTGIFAFTFSSTDQRVFSPKNVLVWNLHTISKAMVLMSNRIIKKEKK